MNERTASGARRVYLKMCSVAEASGRLEDALEEHGIGPKIPESIAPAEALGRTTAATVFAAQCNPHYCASAMDGFAVVAADTVGATESTPKRLIVAEQARPINTGEPLPQGFDAVVMVEDVYRPTEGEIEIQASAAPWQHVRLLGEDVVATDLVVTASRRLAPPQIAAMIASQVDSVLVVPVPRVTLLPTGTEVVRPGGEQLAAGQVIDYDTPLLAGMVIEWGGLPVVAEPVPDDPKLLRAALLEAVATSDLVAVIAGSSAGTADHVPNLIEQLGELLVHGVQISPGKPTAIGVIEGTPVLGVPGYSVAAWTAFDRFAKPIVHRILGMPTPTRSRVRASFRRKVPSRSGMLELLRVRLGEVAGDLVAVPLTRGAGAINSLAQADGLAIIDELAEGVNPGEPIDIELFVEPETLRQTVLAVGSHDIALDLLAQELVGNRGHHRLASTHVGSMGGLRAIAQGEGHLAGVHLLDPDDGSYNVNYVKKLLPHVSLRLVNLVHREVGLMVLPGNPKGISSIEDLTRADIQMINRQRGAGTRVLLDHLLRSASIQPAGIEGYPREVTTHTMVAAAVFGGAADVGLGIRAAAVALGLDFIPLTMERYDLVIPTLQVEHPGVAEILEILSGESARSRRFRERVTALGGYSFEDTGRVVYEQ